MLNLTLWRAILNIDQVTTEWATGLQTTSFCLTHLSCSPITVQPSSPFYLYFYIFSHSEEPCVPLQVLFKKRNKNEKNKYPMSALTYCRLPCQKMYYKYDLSGISIKHVHVYFLGIYSTNCSCSSVTIAPSLFCRFTPTVAFSSFWHGDTTQEETAVRSLCERRSENKHTQKKQRIKNK